MTNSGEYAITITQLRQIAGRINSGGYQVTITGPDGRELTTHTTTTEDRARDWARSYIDHHAAGTLRPARPVQTAPIEEATRATRRPTRGLDRQAARVARLTGLAAPRASGRCHYCGLPLTHGYCDECV